MKIPVIKSGLEPGPEDSFGMIVKPNHLYHLQQKTVVSRMTIFSQLPEVIIMIYGWVVLNMV